MLRFKRIDGSRYTVFAEDGKRLGIVRRHDFWHTTRRGHRMPHFFWMAYNPSYYRIGKSYPTRHQAGEVLMKAKYRFNPDKKEWALR